MAYETYEPYDLTSGQAIQKWVPLDGRNGGQLRPGIFLSARVLFLFFLARLLNHDVALLSSPLPPLSSQPCDDFGAGKT